MAVVVLGQFNPAIFSPAWLASQELVDQSAADNASLQLVSADLAQFQAGWAQVQVTRSALQLQTTNVEEFERLRDLCIGVLTSLNHTPVAAVGINRNYHMKVESQAYWHSIGDMLVPKALWSTFMVEPGMLSTTVWGLRPDDYAGRIQVQVQPSDQVIPGLAIMHNDHFSFHNGPRPTDRSDPNFVSRVTETPKSENVKHVIHVLANEWEKSMTRAEVALRAIWSAPSKS